MKLRIVDVETKSKYQAKVNTITNDVTSVLQQINAKCLLYGDTHYQFTKGVYALTYTNEKKQEYKVAAINIYKQYLNDVIKKLGELRETYVVDAQKMESTTDPVELDLAAREISVMTVDELREFVEEYISDTNLMRLVAVEVKKRNQAGNTVLMGDVVYKDSITDLIDTTIKYYTACRGASRLMVFLPVVEGEVTRVARGNWDQIFKQVELKNRDTIVRVNIKNFIN